MSNARAQPLRTSDGCGRSSVATMGMWSDAMVGTTLMLVGVIWPLTRM
ncbi:hypothetical protein FM114_00935 [Luteococcus japonicus LSP_Lj1]|uniref:Uncharacterized protein n=1 Tax=Luteococcus japonicus LSP_Lj1 TaxID=1255658 RepID=A0A1R4IBZ5_9ACTN|nr:hypothetical protein FM114_00935 [Luteococcus japonicus LSP_Lj1]